MLVIVFSKHTLIKSWKFRIAFRYIILSKFITIMTYI